MRVNVDQNHCGGDPIPPSKAGAAQQDLRTDALPPNDPTVPDLSYLEQAIAQSQQGNPAPLKEALASFFRTFTEVAMNNASNHIGPADLERLSELAAAARAGQLPPNDPDLLRLGAAARRNGRAVGAVYKFFLFFDPYGMFAQFKRAGLRAFQPFVGPVLVVEGDAVRDVLNRHDEFTVDPYGAEMIKTMTPKHNGVANRPGLSTFILSTDDAAVYEPDKKLLAKVVSRRDVRHIRPLLLEDCLSRVGASVRAARETGANQIDLVESVARFVPVTMGRVYLGVPSQETSESFDLTEDMLSYYGDDIKGGPSGTTPLEGTGLLRGDGVVPDEATMYLWIKNAFECFFNNVQRDPAVQAAGFRSCRQLLCLLLKEVGEQKAHMQTGARLAGLGREPGPRQIRNTMLTRLLHCQVTRSEPEHLVTDLRIAENIMGTMVGAVAGQEEATCRVIDALLRLKDGTYQPSRNRRMFGSYEDARRQALTILDRGASWRRRQMARRQLVHYFRECLRMEPQGEVLLRQCVANGTRLFTDPQQPTDSALADFAGNRPLRAGELVFVAHGSAMKDVYEPQEFRLRRRPSDDVHLFYGYGRHKCLGQHISPVIIVESMISVLALENLQRGGQLELDAKNLYTTQLRVSYSDSGTTREFYG